MTDDLDIGYFGPQQWVRPSDSWETIPDDLDAGVLDRALSKLGSVRVTSCTLNASGSFVVDEEFCKVHLSAPGVSYHELPPFWDVRVEWRGVEHTDHILVWLPVRWNGRVLAIGGGGDRCENGFGFDCPQSRVGSPAVGVKNGFVCGFTDGGVPGSDVGDWAFDEHTGQIDWELMVNFSYRSSRRLALVLKTLAHAAYGHDPLYSYMEGSSGGGRQGVAEAELHPEDFDGIWSDCPAVCWPQVIVADLWPSVVMHQLGSSLSPDKLTAFRDYVAEGVGGLEALHERTERIDVAAAGAVGRKTADGPITETDAKAMQMIWDGPMVAGKRLWYGLRPGTRSCNEITQVGLCLTDDGGDPQPFFLALRYIGRWIMEDPSWDWHQVSTGDFSSLMRKSLMKFDCLSASANLSRFAAGGGKLLLSAGSEDPIVFPDGVIRYYHEASSRLGTPEEARRSCRMFVFPGTGHATCDGHAPSFTIADGMAALMRWVERGEAPTSVSAHQLDPQTGQVVREATLEPIE